MPPARPPCATRDASSGPALVTRPTARGCTVTTPTSAGGGAPPGPPAAGAASFFGPQAVTSAVSRRQSPAGTRPCTAHGALGRVNPAIGSPSRGAAAASGGAVAAAREAASGLVRRKAAKDSGGSWSALTRPAGAASAALELEHGDAGEQVRQSARSGRPFDASSTQAVLAPGSRSRRRCRRGCSACRTTGTAARASPACDPTRRAAGSASARSSGS